jgi:FlaA1/EpsC-like NDP-sugar epimerase
MVKPDIVFHAAAYKHVPLMEDSAVEAVRTNVIGTYNTASLSNQYNVKKFVLVSSDKAVRSTNVMGATKRYAELIVQEQQEHSKVTKFSAVRFGNVLGSNGSVIPLFKKQIADGGPVTVTHQDITRYFMTIPEAVGLILQCGVYANGGEVFILDMGEPVKIKDLAEKMISLTGLKPYEDIKIEFTGLRPGEKLFEELLVDHNHEILKNEPRFVFILVLRFLRYLKRLTYCCFELQDDHFHQYERYGLVQLYQQLYSLSSDFYMLSIDYNNEQLDDNLL